MSGKPSTIPISGANWSPPDEMQKAKLEPIDPLQRQLIAALEAAKSKPDFAHVREQIKALAEDGDVQDEMTLNEMFTDVLFGAEALERTLATDPELALQIDKRGRTIDGGVEQ